MKSLSCVRILLMFYNTIQHNEDVSPKSTYLRKSNTFWDFCVSCAVFHSGASELTPLTLTAPSMEQLCSVTVFRIKRILQSTGLYLELIDTKMVERFSPSVESRASSPGAKHCNTKPYCFKLNFNIIPPSTRR
jgi:hypothetical protein